MKLEFPYNNQLENIKLYVDTFLSMTVKHFNKHLFIQAMRLIEIGSLAKTCDMIICKDNCD